MLLCPIQDGSAFKLNWVRTKPRITQHFGLNPATYSSMGLKGHNGTDFGVPIGTPIYADMAGEVKWKDSGTKGYGLHVKIRNPYKCKESIFAHLSKVNVANGTRINMGDLIGYSGSTGFSTGPHLHYGHRMLKPGKKNKLFEWYVMDYNNGFKGYYDVIDFLVRWKGSLVKNTI